MPLAIRKPWKASIGLEMSWFFSYTHMTCGPSPSILSTDTEALTCSYNSTAKFLSSYQYILAGAGLRARMMSYSISISISIKESNRLSPYRISPPLLCHNSSNRAHNIHRKHQPAHGETWRYEKRICPANSHKSSKGWLIHETIEDDIIVSYRATQA